MLGHGDGGFGTPEYPNGRRDRGRRRGCRPRKLGRRSDSRRGPCAKGQVNPAFRTWMNMGSVVVVGGSGFIGTHVARRLEAAGLDVSIFDLAKPPKGSHARAIQGDVFQAEEIEAGIRGSEIVIDLVGLADIGEGQKKPGRSFRFNFESLIRVLEASPEEGIRRVIFPSPAALYGKVQTVPIDGTAQPNPSPVYGWHKG